MNAVIGAGGVAGVRPALANGAGQAPRPARTRTRAAFDLLRIMAIAVVFCYVWRIQDLFPALIPLKFVPLSTLAALGLFVVSPPALAALKRVKQPIMKWALVMFVIIVLSVPESIWPGNSFDFIIQDHIKTILMMLVVLGSIRSYIDVERYAAAQLLGGVVWAFFVLFKFQLGSDGRLSNLEYYDANDLGMLMVGTVPLVLYFSRRSSPIALRVLSLVAGGLYAMAIVKTGSRGAFLGIIAVGVVSLLTFKAMPVKSRVSVVVAGVLAFSLIATDQYWTMMRTLLNPQDDYNWTGKSESGRMEIWKRGIGYMVDRPFTGVGAQSFPTAEGTLSPLAVRQNLGRGVRWAAAHNAFVQIGAELGVPGLLVFLTMLAAAFRTTNALARRRPDDDPGRRSEVAMWQSLRICMVGYVVTAFFLSQGYAAYLYAMLALIAGFAAVARVPEGVRVPRWSMWWRPTRQRIAR